jgi:hypothetical protein
MPAIGSEIYVQFATESKKRILHPANVRRTTSDGYLIQMLETDVSFNVGGEVRLFFDDKRTFMQQPARVDAQLDAVEMDGETPEHVPSMGVLLAGDANDGPTLAIATTGDAVSAEGRECYRVLTVFSDYVATTAGEADCSVLDVSATGFAVICTQRHDSAATIEVTVSHEGDDVTGNVVVQSERELADGRYRYGLHCADSRGSAALLKMLQRISLAVQRAQARRLSGMSA